MKNYLARIGMPMMLRGKIALISGATGGLGREISHQLASAGCKLRLLGTNNKKLSNLKNELGDSVIGTHEVNFLTTSWYTQLENVKDVDILVNNAGVFPVNSLLDTTFEEFENCYKINVLAPFILTKMFSKGMIEKSWGRIINVGSSSAYAGFENTSTYCSSKHALLGFSRSMFKELRNTGVRVYSVSPGSIKTPMGKLVPNQDYDTFMDPTEIADFMVKIMSYNSDMISEEVRLNRVIVQ